MTETQRQSIAHQMQRYPEVRWDRFIEMDGEWEGQGSAFGWLDREDGRADFVALHWEPYAGDGELGFSISTSSAERSLEFAQRLHGEQAVHFDCQRVEDRFGDLVTNVIRL
jgi:hypothetical protein